MTLTIALAAGLVAPDAVAAETPTKNTITGQIEALTVLNPADPYSKGTLVIGGQTITLPRNLVIDLPANRLTAQQLIDQAPGDCGGVSSGLALTDACADGTVGYATVHANRTASGEIVAGEVEIEKGQETLSGVVTYVNHLRGYLRVGGGPLDVGLDQGGTVLRINDPSARFTIQRGIGCSPTNGTTDNCSADPRFGVDPDNYTVTFSTGYPGCIPSTVDKLTPNFSTDPRVQNRTTEVTPGFKAATAAGLNDTFCPSANRVGNPAVADATKFAPIKLGDHIAAEGNIETIRGTPFFSAHTLAVDTELTTGPNQPNYMIFDEVEWDIAGFQNERVRVLLIGFATDISTQGQPEIYAVDINPTTGAESERMIASVAGCEAGEGIGECAAQGIPPTGANIFRIRYDVDFGLGVDDRRSPCLHLNALATSGQTIGGAPVPLKCPVNFTLADEVSVIVPPARDLIGRTRRKADTLPGTYDVRDMTGNTAPWGEYLNPVGMGHPEFVEINLAALATPYIFTGETWLLDRRTGPGGCVSGNCSTDTDVRLDPFPFSCLDPAAQVLTNPFPSVTAFRNQILKVPTGGDTKAQYNAVIAAAGCPVAPPNAL